MSRRIPTQGPVHHFGVKTGTPGPQYNTSKFKYTRYPLRLRRSCRCCALHIVCMYILVTHNKHSHEVFPAQYWFLKRANTMSKRKLFNQKICCFCGLPDDNELEYGKFYEHGDVVTHYYCLLLSSNMEQKGRDNDGILGFLLSDIQKEIRRGKRLVCSYCKKSGATLGCCNSKCKRIFHYPCGLRAGSLNQFFGEFRSYCQNHRPRQKIDLKVKNELEQINDIKCYICYDNVNPTDTINTIWAPCCKKNTWFHRKCVQQLAMSAGYFFKCPLCNDKKKFQKAMLEYGIFIPRQDASWELEPNAFQELLFRHDQCDALICLCPKGRKYTSFNAKWELVLCRTCGSQGIHMSCGQLKWSNPIWECAECISILDKSKPIANTDTPLSMLQTIETDSDESDSDISVGKELPVPYTIDTLIPIEIQEVPPTIKLRPGPRTFKLRQQHQIAKEMEELKKRNGRQHNAEKTNMSSNQISVEECANNKNASSYKSNLSKKDIKLETECCKSVTVSPTNNVIMIDSDDEMNASTSTLDNTILIADIDTPVRSNAFSLENDILKDKKNDTTQSSSSFRKEVLHPDNGQQNHKFNLSVPGSNRLEEQNLQDTKAIYSNDTIHLNVESDCNSNDSLSNIRISNIISLTHEEFESVSVNEEQEINPKSHSSHSKTDDFEIRLKRTIDNVITNSLNASGDKSKKIRRSLNIYEYETKSLLERADIKNSTKSNVFRNNTSASIFDTDSMRISRDYNVANHLPSRVEKHSVKNANSDIQIPNVNYAIKEDMSTVLHNAACSTLSERKEENIENGEGPISEARNIGSGVRNCDADAGTGPAAAARSGYRILASNERIDSLQSGTTNQRKLQTNIEMAAVSNHKTNASSINQRRDRNSESDHYRLIPEYIRLCDLKFRVCNSNNFMMILYNKFSININMETSTVAKRTDKFDVSARKTVQQKYIKAFGETSSVLKPESSLYSSTPISKSRDTHSVFVNDQSESYRDDSKENLDPISCKSLTNNGNNQCENSNATNSVSKTIEEDNQWHNRENINLTTDITNIYDTDELVADANDKCFWTINSIKQNVPKVESIGSINKNDPFDATNAICTNSKFKNRKKNRNKIHLKISIDLEKIENFIDTNPQLFSKDQRKSEERKIGEVGLLKECNDISERISASNKHTVNSMADDSKHLGNFSLSLTGNRITEFEQLRKRR
nr:uncharacterized protein LOC117227412 isoform X1 [Megalopta genalis]